MIVAMLAAFAGGSYYLRTRNPAPAPAPKTLNPQSEAKSYTVRGRIEELPVPGQPSSTLQIHHEEIKSFVGRDGALGMSEMTMSFPYSSGVSLGGLSIGDEVEFLLEVNWGGSPLYQITRLTRLPADTQLNFDPAPGN